MGRLLGPRGSTLRKIEDETGCRIHIRGAGSLRSKEEVDNRLFCFNQVSYCNSFVKEEEKRTKAGYEHLNEDLHVVVEASMDEDQATEAIEAAKEIISSLLVPFVRVFQSSFVMFDLIPFFRKGIWMRLKQTNCENWLF
jgi:protein quaking